jgi:hypothetical protein
VWRFIRKVPKQKAFLCALKIMKTKERAKEQKSERAKERESGRVGEGEGERAREREWEREKT